MAAPPFPVLCQKPVPAAGFFRQPLIQGLVLPRLPQLMDAPLHPQSRSPVLGEGNVFSVLRVLLGGRTTAGGHGGNEQRIQRITEPWNALGWEGPSSSSRSNPLLRAGTPSTRPGCSQPEGWHLMIGPRCQIAAGNKECSRTRQVRGGAGGNGRSSLSRCTPCLASCALQAARNEPQGTAGRGHLSGPQCRFIEDHGGNGKLVALAWEGGDEDNVALPSGCVGAALKPCSHKMVLPVETS